MVSTLYVVIILVAVALVVAAFLYWRSQHIKAEKPTAPSDVQLVPVSGANPDCSTWQAQLKWTESEGASPLTYKWSLSNNGQVVASGTSANSESTILTSQQLGNNTTYQAEVVAVNSFGSASSGKTSVTTASPIVIDQFTLTHLNDPTNGYLVVIANTDQPIDSKNSAITGQIKWHSETGDEYDQGVYTSTTPCLLTYAMNVLQKGNSNGAFVITSGSQSWTYTWQTSGGWGGQWFLGSTRLFTDYEVIRSVEKNISQLTTGSIAFAATPTQPFAVISNGQLCLGTCPTNTLAFLFPTDASLTTGTNVIMTVVVQTTSGSKCHLQMQFTV